MEITKKVVSTVLFLLSFYSFSFAECNILSGLYDKRIEVKEKKNLLWNRLKPWKEKSVENEYLEVKKELDDIDAKYALIINEMFSQLKRGENKLYYECCNNSIRDRILFIVCSVVRYKHSGDVNQFLRNIPINEIDLEPLWTIDDIVMGQKAAEFQKATFVQTLFEEMYDLAARGNSSALERLFQINRYADGWYAEELQELIFKLIKGHPLVIMDNLDIINKHKSTVSLETTNYASEADEIIQNYKHTCAKEKMTPSTCKQIIYFLNEKKR